MGESYTSVSFERNGAIALIRINNPPVNALSQGVRQGLVDAVDELESSEEIKAALIVCEGRTFVAGADVREFGLPPSEPHLPAVLAKIDSCSKPIVAAMFGTSLGGGFELAMSCHYRVVLKGAQVGLPEVNLGLIPGAGGTQLLPRLVGVSQALELATSGKPVLADKLAETKVVDLLVDDNLTEAAIDFTRALAESDTQPRRTTQMAVLTPENQDELFNGWRRKLEKKARGQIAPLHIVQSIKNSLTMSFSEGQAEERKFFIECRESPQSRAMRHAFFAEREVAKIPDFPKDLKLTTIEKVAVIGAGTMGGAIAMCFASRGISVRILEISSENLERGLNLIKDNYEKTLSRGIISEDQKAAALQLIAGTTSYDDLADVDLVVEAAFENIDIKRQIFQELDNVCKTTAILASNTSYLDLDAIAESTSRPNQVVGMHFFSPANVMKLLEVVRGKHTDTQTLAAAMALGKRIGKISVAVGNCYGFVGNRMYARYGREANALLLEGASPEQVDSAMRNWGMAMGPLEVNDMSGIDIAYKARQENKHRFADDPLYFRAADLMVESGRLGRKTGAGFYRYEEGVKQSDPDAILLIQAEAQRVGVEQRDDIGEEEIQDRLINALVREGNKILEEGIALRASDIDVIWLNGYGFPRFRGGPMFYSEDRSQ